MDSQTIVPGAPVDVAKSLLSMELKRKLAGTSDNEDLYILRYKKGQVMQSLNFWYSGGKQAAISAARKYCDSRRLRFIWCDEFCVDIDAPVDGD
jgi:hypothetical protein